MARLTSDWRYGDLPDEDTIRHIGQVALAVMSFMADETRALADEGTESMFFVGMKLTINGEPQRIAVSMPDDAHKASELMDELLGAVRQKISEEKAS